MAKHCEAMFAVKRKRGEALTVCSLCWYIIAPAFTSKNLSFCRNFVVRASSLFGWVVIF